MVDRFFFIPNLYAWSIFLYPILYFYIDSYIYIWACMIMSNILYLHAVVIRNFSLPTIIVILKVSHWNFVPRYSMTNADRKYHLSQNYSYHQNGVILNRKYVLFAIYNTRKKTLFEFTNTSYFILLVTIYDVNFHKVNRVVHE